MYFGEFLISESLITRTQLEEALQVQKNGHSPIGQTLVGLGYLPADGLDSLLEAHLLRCAEQVISETDNS